MPPYHTRVPIPIPDHVPVPYPGTQYPGTTTRYTPHHRCHRSVYPSCSPGFLFPTHCHRMLRPSHRPRLRFSTDLAYCSPKTSLLFSWDAALCRGLYQALGRLQGPPGLVQQPGRGGSVPRIEGSSRALSKARQRRSRRRWRGLSQGEVYLSRQRARPSARLADVSHPAAMCKNKKGLRPTGAGLSGRCAHKAGILSKRHGSAVLWLTAAKAA